MGVNESFRLNGRIAIVTGASRGLGRAMAVALAEAGADVVVTARTAQDLEETAAQIRERGRKAEVVPADVSNEEQVQRVVRAAMDSFGRIDILVNNAGLTVEKPLLETSLEEWDLVLNTDLRGMFLFSKTTGEYLVAQKRGKIINIASIFGPRGVANVISYCTAKEGVIGFTRALAVEWAPYNIHVNAIVPGYFNTAINQRIISDSQAWSVVKRRVALGRWAEPEEIGPAVVFLASDASNYMTGSLIFVDGGVIAKY